MDVTHGSACGDSVERAAQALLEHEVLNRDDMISLIGPRPFEDKKSHADLAFVDDACDDDDAEDLPDSTVVA